MDDLDDLLDLGRSEVESDNVDIDRTELVLVPTDVCFDGLDFSFSLSLTGVEDLLSGLPTESGPRLFFLGFFTFLMTAVDNN